MKRFYSSFFLFSTFVLTTLTLCISCSNNIGVLEDSVTSQHFVPKSIRNLESAKGWANKSLMLLGGYMTKGGQIRKIESWNVLTQINTKSNAISQDTLLYVFNFAENSGFSIIAASSNIEPIVAVAETGHYVAGESTGNYAFDEYMEGIVDRLSMELNDRELYSWHDYVMEGDSLDRSVNVLWGQEDIYGQYCPNGIAGCTATAIAQIMAYYRSPSSFNASTDMGNDFVTGATVPLDWSGILEHDVTHNDIKTCNSYHNQIAALFREIGYQLDMNYGPGGSTAQSSDVLDAFRSFGYTTSGPIAYNKSMIKNMLKLHGPIYMDGYRDSGNGHSWVVDGYKDYSYCYCKFERAVDDGHPAIITQRDTIRYGHSFHINWGWDGDCNGYYSFDIFDIDNAESYDVSHFQHDRNYLFNKQFVVAYPTE